MTDIHCHILPGVDDGAENLHRSLQMAEIASSCGIKVIAATPHLDKPDEAHAALFGERLIQLRRHLSENGINLPILPGAEIMGKTDIASSQVEYFTINGSRYLLVEFFPDDYPERVSYVLESLLSKKLIPVIAHPERYGFVQENPAVCASFVSMGCLLQINAQSFIGLFGESARRAAFDLAHLKLIHAVASDAHSTSFRPPDMRAAERTFADRYGKQSAVSLFSDGPRKIVRNLDF